MLHKNSFTTLLFVFAIAAILSGCRLLAPTEEIIFEDITPSDENTPPTDETISPDKREREVDEVETSEEVSAETITAVGWYGTIESLPEGAQFDDKLILHPEGAGEFGIAGVTPEIEEMIIVLRDKPDPGKNAHFWGEMICDVPDVNGCQLLIEKMRVDGPGDFFEPDIVEGWRVTLTSMPDAPQVDDALTLCGDVPVQYGIWTLEDEFADKLNALRDTGIEFLVWGELLCGVIDANGCQLHPSQIEIP